MTSRKHAEEGSDPHDVRREALKRLRQHRPADLSVLDVTDLKGLIHELEVHQAELEVQNEELRRAQTELANARNRYEDLYEFAPVGYLTLDRQGEILQANLAATKLLCDMDRRALLGRRIERLLVMGDRDISYALLRDAAALGAARTKEFRLQCANGTTRWVSATASPLEGPPGQRAPGFRVTLSDIQERKQVEQQLKDLAATLEQRVKERTAQLQALAGQLSQAEQRERHRLAKILHDHLQQLLVGAMFSLSTLRNEIHDGKLLQAVERVNDLVRESVDTSRSLTVELSPPILYEGTMRQVLEWLARWMHEKHGLAVHLEVDEQANPQREEIRVLIFEVVRELLLNVVKYAQVGQATVGMARDGEGLVVVTVADEGVGFDPQHMRPNDTGGFGLLSIQQRLAALTGQIEIDSVPGRGTRIRLRLPADVQPGGLEKEMRPAGWRAGAGRAAVPHERIRVLLADDHAVVRDGLARLLDMQPDIEVIGRASDGQQVVEMALQLQPDVVIMDVSMPGLTGMEATREILVQRPQTRIIGLSMHTEPDIAEAMRQAGAAAYLAKTSRPEVLVATIREHRGEVVAR